jgi:signal transduction histidine kinase
MPEPAYSRGMSRLTGWLRWPGGQLPWPGTGRWGLRHWIAVDCAAAVAIGAALVGSAGSDGAPGRRGWAGVLLVAAVCAPLAVRRLWPVPVLLIALAGAPAMAAADLPPQLNLAYAVYPVAVACSTRRALLALLACWTSLLVSLAVLAPTAARSTAHLQSATLLVAVVWAIALAVRYQRVQTRLAAQRAEQQAREHVIEERLQIARELHDVLAHSMSLITVQAGVANYLINDRPDAAADALTLIEATSRTALVELRRLLGVLRDGPVLSPVPGLAALERLAAGAQQAGLRVRVEVHGPRGELPAAVDLAAYRIVQEALTNVVKHAGAGWARICLDYEAAGLRVTITDPGPGRDRGPGPAGRPAVPATGTVAEPGHGLIGMRERAAACGGELVAGPSPTGGFEVAAWFPLATERHAQGAGTTGQPA